MIVDIGNELLTKIKTEVSPVRVLTSYQGTVPSFPTILFEEDDNSAMISTKDSAGFQHSNIAYTIEIYTEGDAKVTEAKRLRNKIDKIMSEDYGMTRGRPMVIPNYLDNTIYRYKLRYTGTIDKNKKIYRG